MIMIYWFSCSGRIWTSRDWNSYSWLIWEDSNDISNNLLSYIIKVYTWELGKLKIFWWDYPAKDGTWVRDYIDVVDLVR